MREILEQAVRGRAFEYGVISTVDINFYPELLKSCETNVCGKYNKSWTCPPAIGPLEKQREKISAYSHAFVFTTKADLEDSFDYEGMMEAKGCHDRITAEMHEKFGKTNPVFGAGGCSLCERCAYPDPCRFPEKTYSSIEAAGINVTELSRAGGLRYNNGENTITYFSMILFND
jgi:predicted metal-binding protein